MKIYKNICYICLLCSFSIAGAEPPFRVQSIKSVVEKPEEFQGAKIAIVGRLNLEFERDIISSIECDKVANQSVSELWVDVPKALLKSAEKLNHTNVKIFGRFNSKKNGHMGAFPGTIKIEKIEKIKSDKPGC